MSDEPTLLSKISCVRSGSNAKKGDGNNIIAAARRYARIFLEKPKPAEPDYNPAFISLSPCTLEIDAGVNCQ